MLLQVNSTILAILFIVIAVGWFLGWLLYFRIKKNLFNQKHQYVDEKLIKTNKFALGVYDETQTLYSNNNFKLDYIDQYVVSNDKNIKKIIIKYQEEVDVQPFNILCFDKKLNIIEVIKVEEFNNKMSAEFVLNKKTSFLNITDVVYRGKYNQRKVNLIKLILVNTMFISFIISVSYFVMSLINRNFLSIYLDQGGLMLWMMLVMFAILGFLAITLTRYSLVNTKEIIYHEK